MRKPTCYRLAMAVLCLLPIQMLLAQSTGYINRPATAVAGRAVLDPNGNSYTSLTTAGFNGDDVTNSEIPFKSIRSYSVEPFGDLRRGPDHRYSDFVPDANSNGYYVYYDGTNLLFRWRMGSVMPGSKGYSVLLDTDGKFGATGTNADPNYQAETTGTNGNPGFEIEVVFETNFRIAIYNVDGASSGTLVKQYTNWKDMSQVSIAATNDNGDPDFLIDFYIPYTDLMAAPFNLTTSTNLRFSATTVMAPQGAIGGPKSDIYGLNDAGYKSTSKQWEDFINEQPPVKPTDLGSGGSGQPARCTAAPTLASATPGTGTGLVKGTWTKSSLTGSLATADITVYRTVGGTTTTLGTVNGVASGSSWTLSGVTFNGGDLITAKAKGATESMCLVSNAVAAQACNTATIPSNTGLTIRCISTRGIEGLFPSGNTVKIYWMDPATLNASVLAGAAANSPTFGYNLGTDYYYNGTSYNGSQVPSACSGGSQDMNNGSYWVTTIAPSSTCESAPVFGCVGLTATATPTITETVLYNTHTSISGTATAGSTVRLRINGQLINSVLATGGNYSFTGLTLTAGDVLDVKAVTTGSCLSTSATIPVSCFTAVPLINADNNSQVASATAITGVSAEPTGSTIRVYTSPSNTLVATTTVQANGTWSTGNAGTTPATYNAVAATVYYATAQNSCGTSAASGTVTAVAATSSARCGTITGPVTSGAPSVSGTLTGAVAGTIVNLYNDGILVGSTTTGSTAWTITAPANSLYPDGVLTIGIQESGSREVLCAATLTITCASGPATPIISPATTSIVAGQSTTYTISNAVAGSFYGIADGSSGRSLGTGKWATANGSLTLTTDAFNAAGNYTVVVKATSLSEVTVCSSQPGAASVSVSGILPVSFISLHALRLDASAQLNWVVANEQGVLDYRVERSTDGRNYTEVGRVAFHTATGSRNNYSFLDATAPAGTLLYRIRQVDVDSRSNYSGIVRLAADGVRGLQLAPNPAKERITLSLLANERGLVTITLLELTGRPVYQVQAEVRKGANVLSLQQLDRFARGQYILRVEGAGAGGQVKLLLQ